MLEKEKLTSLYSYTKIPIYHDYDMIVVDLNQLKEENAFAIAIQK